MIKETEQNLKTSKKSKTTSTNTPLISLSSISTNTSPNNSTSTPVIGSTNPITISNSTKIKTIPLKQPELNNNQTKSTGPQPEFTSSKSCQTEHSQDIP